MGFGYRDEDWVDPDEREVRCSPDCVCCRPVPDWGEWAYCKDKDEYVRLGEICE